MVATGRPGDHDASWLVAGSLVHDRQGPEVPHRAFLEGRRPDYPLELDPHAFAAQRPASQPVRMGTPNPHGPA